MICNFFLCMYQEDGLCLLKSVEINEFGMCDCAIVPPLPDAQLSDWKRRAREADLIGSRVKHPPKPDRRP